MMILITHGPQYTQLVPETFMWDPLTLARILDSLMSKKSVKVLEENSAHRRILRIIVVLGGMGGHRMEMSLPTETDPLVEEGHQDLRILLAGRMANRLVQEDTTVISVEDHQEAILTVVGPVTVSILRKRKAKENGSSTIKLVLERYRNGTVAPRL